MDKLKSRLKKAGFIIVIIYVMIGGLLYTLQEKMLFLPSVLADDYTFQFDTPFKEVNLKPEKEVLINALHFKAEQSQGVILYFHGNAGDLSRWGHIAAHFVKYDYDVFVIDYRTYGKSKGELSEQAFFDDAQYCYQYLMKTYNEENIIVYGRSLGTGIAAHLASNNKPQHLILETPYYSIADVAQHRFPIFPVKYLLRYHFKTFEVLPNVNCPIHIIHGTNDKIVPYESGKKLTELGIKNLSFVTLKEGEHHNLNTFNTYHKTIASILK